LIERDKEQDPIAPDVHTTAFVSILDSTKMGKQQ